MHFRIQQSGRFSNTRNNATQPHYVHIVNSRQRNWIVETERAREESKMMMKSRSLRQIQQHPPILLLLVESRLEEERGESQKHQQTKNDNNITTHWSEVRAKSLETFDKR